MKNNKNFPLDLEVFKTRMKSKELLPFSEAPQRQHGVKAKGCVSFPGLPSHKTTGCKTTEMYPLTVLKVKSWKPRYQPAVSKAPGRNHARPPCWLLVAASGAWRPWLAVALLQSLPESPCGFVSASSSLSYKDLTHRIEGTLEFSTTSSELFNNCICKHTVSK